VATTVNWIGRSRTLAALAVVLLLVGACGGGAGKEEESEALGMLSTSLPSGAVNSLYGVNLFGTGGSGAGYTWALVLGELPPGIRGLPAVGQGPRLSGVPTTAGTYAFTVRLQDSAGDSADTPLRIVIDPVSGPGPGGGSPTSTIGAPTGRSGHTAVWTGSEMIVWGGTTRLSLLNSGGAYRAATDTWRAVSSIGAPEARSSHSAVWTGTEMIVFGGWGVIGRKIATGGAYNPASNTWRPLPATGAPRARLSHSAVWTGSRMIIWGGTGEWPPGPPSPNSVDLVFNDGFSYDPANNSWTPTALSAKVGRNHVTVWTGSRMIVWGGTDSFALGIQTVSEGGIYDAAANSWSVTTTATAPAARLWHTGVWSGNELIIWGGSPNGIARLDTGGRFQPNTNSWQPTSTVGAPTARTGHTAVWTGAEMAVWGGSDSVTGVVAGGGAYNPVTNGWRPVPAVLDPNPRTSHTAVWTGTAMIVWGGVPGNVADVYLDTGAVIQP